MLHCVRGSIVIYFSASSLYFICCYKGLWKKYFHVSSKISVVKRLWSPMSMLQYCNGRFVSYCQDCLDNITVVAEDGSGGINSPLRCSKKGLIEKKETTSSLSTAYSLGGIIDKMYVMLTVQSPDWYVCNNTNRNLFVW